MARRNQAGHRDFARASQEADIHGLVDELERVSPEFKAWWRKHDVHAPCDGVRRLRIDGQATPFDYTSLTVDADRHLRLVVYARQRESKPSSTTSLPNGPAPR